MLNKRFIIVMMQQQEREESSGVEIIQIKDDPSIDCSHRIVELLFHQNCSKNAQVCEQSCHANLAHDFPTSKHEKAKIEVFKTAFNNLQQTCQQSAEYYIKQISHIEQQAYRNILKKKAESLKQVQNLKKAILSLTYSDLETKYPYLLQKFKNARFDTLSCNEVFWVMRTNKRPLPLKNSQLNSKFEKIIKSFENYKDVSRNLNPKQTKEKAKEVKICQKIKEPEIKVRPSIALPKPDYSANNVSKTHMQIRALQQKRKGIQQDVKTLGDEKARLSQMINRLLYSKRQKENRLKIQPNIINIKIPQYFTDRSQTTLINGIQGQSYSTQERINQLAQLPKAQEISPEKNRMDPQRQFNQQPRYQNQHLQRILQRLERQSNQNKDIKDNQANNSREQINREQPVPQNKANQQEPPPLQLTTKTTTGQKFNERSDQEEEEKQSQKSNKNAPNVEPSLQQPERISPPVQQKNQRPSSSIQAQQVRVKQEYVAVPFEPWRNQQLLGEMKRYGRTEQSCLKVQNIDILKSFPTVHLKAPKSRISSSLMRSNMQERPQIFNSTAMQLMQKELKRKAQLSNKPS